MFLFFSISLVNWPQSYFVCENCIGLANYTHLFHHNALAAATVVKVYNPNLKEWQKIKVVVGYFCAKVNS